jgi:flagellin-like hook-associated protein FlgL
MSGIVRSASVRQNLLSLQSTATMLATTQNDLATGLKVNSALDNPTNYFTAQGLNNRASDISNLLDSIGNGVQILQAANTGLTSLQSLVDSAKSIANQVLQSPVGYSTRSTSTSSALTGTAGNLVDNTDIKSNETLTFAATDGGTATTITFGAGVGQVQSLSDLNAALAADNITASLNGSNQLVFTTTNDAASSTISVTVGGGGTATFGAGTTPTADAASQATRANLVAQYNSIITQITNTAQDSSFNGVNLLNGDTLKLVFDETGKSTLSITGVSYDAAGLGLSSLTAGTDFLDNGSANKVLTALNNASTSLRTEASALGSNLSVVQIRQDFNKNLINVLQTGASNLTLADTNELAADSQALQTRQSIAISALSLTNQAQASVLQLLR